MLISSGLKARFWIIISTREVVVSVPVGSVVWVSVVPVDVGPVGVSVVVVDVGSWVVSVPVSLWHPTERTTRINPRTRSILTGVFIAVTEPEIRLY